MKLPQVNPSNKARLLLVILGGLFGIAGIGVALWPYFSGKSPSEEAAQQPGYTPPKFDFSSPVSSNPSQTPAKGDLLRDVQGIYGTAQPSGFRSSAPLPLSPVTDVPATQSREISRGDALQNMSMLVEQGRAEPVRSDTALVQELQLLRQITQDAQRELAKQKDATLRLAREMGGMKSEIEKKQEAPPEKPAVPTSQELQAASRLATAQKVQYGSPMHIATRSGYGDLPNSDLAPGDFISARLVTNVVLGVQTTSEFQAEASDGSKFLGTAVADLQSRRIYGRVHTHVESSGSAAKVEGELFDESKTSGVVSWTRDNLGTIMAGQVGSDILKAAAAYTEERSKTIVSNASGSDIVSNPDEAKKSLYSGAAAGASMTLSDRLTRLGVRIEVGASAGTQIWIMILPPGAPGREAVLQELKASNEALLQQTVMPSSSRR